MQTITIKVTDGNARLWAVMLRERYGRDKRTGLDRLAEIAVRRAVLEQLSKECYAGEALLEAEDNEKGEPHEWKLY
ncbi:MAG: hypothetical protein ABIG63_16335 [Chloroflexota bacterium]